MLRVAVAGSTIYTSQCAQTFLNHDQFELVYAITPTPKPVGRKKALIPNPVDQLFTEHDLPVIRVDKKLNELKDRILELPVPDLLLVVDFGYIIPKWLLELPKVAPLNVHPSLLPRWRGSAPGQYVLLAGEKESAVTLMKINELVDQGPIIAQKKFSVSSEWNHQDYYDFAFNLICQDLPELCLKYTQSRKETPQPVESPTPYAEKLKKEHGFVDWNNLTEDKSNQDACSQWERASRAYYPWPGLWTVVPTHKGEKRMKILQLDCVDGRVVLKKVQFEGQEPALWNQVKNQLAFDQTSSSE